MVCFLWKVVLSHIFKLYTFILFSYLQFSISYKTKTLLQNLFYFSYVFNTIYDFSTKCSWSTSLSEFNYPILLCRLCNILFYIHQSILCVFINVLLGNMWGLTCLWAIVNYFTFVCPDPHVVPISISICVPCTVYPFYHVRLRFCWMFVILWYCTCFLWSNK